MTPTQKRLLKFQQQVRELTDVIDSDMTSWVDDKGQVQGLRDHPNFGPCRQLRIRAMELGWHIDDLLSFSFQAFVIGITCDIGHVRRGGTIHLIDPRQGVVLGNFEWTAYAFTHSDDYPDEEGTGLTGDMSDDYPDEEGTGLSGALSDDYPHDPEDIVTVTQDKPNPVTAVSNDFSRQYAELRDAIDPFEMKYLMRLPSGESRMTMLRMNPTFEAARDLWAVCRVTRTPIAEPWGSYFPAFLAVVTNEVGSLYNGERLSLRDSSRGVVRGNIEVYQPATSI